jgi:hypothetical protein
VLEGDDSASGARFARELTTSKPWSSASKIRAGFIAPRVRRRSFFDREVLQLEHSIFNAANVRRPKSGGGRNGLLKSPCQCWRRHIGDSGDILCARVRGFDLGEVVGFVSTSNGDQRNLTDYGYSEALDDAQSHGSPDSMKAGTCPAASAETLDGASSPARETMISQIGLGPGRLLTTGR